MTRQLLVLRMTLAPAATIIAMPAMVQKSGKSRRPADFTRLG
jgi:hypothetical protein